MAPPAARPAAPTPRRVKAAALKGSSNGSAAALVSVLTIMTHTSATTSPTATPMGPLNLKTTEVSR